MFSSARIYAGEHVKRLRPSTIEPVAPYEPLLFLYPRCFQQAFRRLQHHHARETHTMKAESARRPLRPASEKLTSLSSQSSDQSFSSHIAGCSTTGIPDTAKPRHLNLNNIAPRVTNPEQPTATSRDIENTFPKTGYHADPIRYRMDFNPAGINGLALARKLASLANSPSLVHHDTMRLPVSFLEWFVGTAEPNMWFHREKSGCRIHVLPQAEDNAIDREIVFEGSEQSRELARHYLIQRRNDFKLVQQEKIANTEVQLDKPEEKNCQKFYKKHTNIKNYIHVSHISTPTTWSIKSFYTYVKSILDNRAPRGVERGLYTGDDNFDRSASQLLLQTFATPELSEYQSVAALRLVLSHFQRRTQAATNIGLIWTSAIENGLVPDVACFNHELARAMKVNNVDRIDHILWNMRIFRIKPDAITWGILLKTLQTPAQRRNLINALLRSHRLSTPYDRNIIVRALVEAEFKQVIALEDGLPKFAGWLHKRFGNSWLSPSTVCEMIRQCMKSTVASKVHEVLDIARYFGITLNQLDNTALLDIIRRTGSFGDTLRVFVMLPRSHDHETSQTHVNLLFKIAWRQRLFNTCRLIWLYAATEGLVSHSMQRLLTTNLAMNQESETATSKCHPNLSPKLAAFTIGTDISIEDFETKFPLLSKVGNSQEPRELLCQWMPGDGPRHEQMQLVHLLLERDLSATKIFRPMDYQSFLKQLSQAFHFDLQWAKDDDYVARAPIADLLRQSIKIGLRHKHMRPRSLVASADSELVKPDIDTLSTLSRSAHAKADQEGERASQTRDTMPLSAIHSPFRAKMYGMSNRLETSACKDEVR